jgi:hypothetical protein
MLNSINYSTNTKHAQTHEAARSGYYHHKNRIKNEEDDETMTVSQSNMLCTTMGSPHLTVFRILFLVATAGRVAAGIDDTGLCPLFVFVPFTDK